MSTANDSRRSEIVRKRRQREAQKRLTETGSLATRPLTPITSRVNAIPSSPQRRATTPQRPQAALTMPGVQVRMPAISFTGPQIKWRLLSLSIALLLGSGLYLGSTAPEFRSAVPSISGNERIPSTEIAGVLAAEGSNIFSLVPADLETRVRLNFPELISARIELELPNMVVVKVVERKPVILWQQGDVYTWIDEHGIAFRPRGAASGLIPVQALEAPSLEGTAKNDPSSPAPYISPDMVAAVGLLSTGLPSSTPLLYDPRYGFGWADSRGWRVFFGTRPDDVPLKLEVYSSLVTTLESKGIAPAFIDVEYPSSPYYRLNQ